MGKSAGILLVLLCCFATLSFRAAGQAVPDDRPANPNTPKVTAAFVPDSIAIGDHFRLRIEVEKDIVQQIGFPVRDSASNKFTEHIEILEEYPVDTAALDGRRVTLRKEYLLTTFKAGKHSVRGIPILYIDKNITDTLQPDPDSLLLQVGTFEIDTLTQTIHDIKAPMKMPLRFGEIGGYIVAGLVFIGLLILTIHFVRKWRDQSSGFWRRRSQEPVHVLAIRALEALHHQKLWQNNRHKQYYSILTDIVRTYIEGRYGLQAMEMTSGELLEALKGYAISDGNLSRLGSMLHLADLAKFAKFAPDADDNETAYSDAYYFVEETKPSEVEPQTPQEDGQ